MLNISLLALTLYGGVLVEPFRVAEHQPGHNQIYGCAAMASDGHFAVAWIDSIASGDPFNPNDLEPELFIRFFDRDGDPMTEAYKITKLADTSWISRPCLEMDTAGNTILLWADKPIWREDEPWYAWYVRFQRFAPDGSPVSSARTLVAHASLGRHTQTLPGGEKVAKPSPIDLSLNNNEEFVVTWCEIESGPPILNYVWVGRFDMEGYPENRPFLTCDAECVFSYYPRVALNDAGDVAVTWRNPIWGDPDSTYQRFQVFDAADEPILSWRPWGHLLYEQEGGGMNAQLFWLDNDRFVAFFRGLEGFLEARVFAHRGLASYPPCLLVNDPNASATREKRFSVALSSDGQFAETHLRHSKLHEEPDCLWWRPGGIIGEIRDKEVWRRTNLFDYTAPFGKDTTFKTIFVPAVGACDNRIVWVYPHSTPDSLCEAWVLISDWDMGVGISESPVQTASPIKLEAFLNRLAYDVPGEALLTLYSADGRRVLEETIKGEGIWQAPSLPSGVYFARVEDGSFSATQKLILVK